MFMASTDLRMAIRDEKNPRTGSSFFFFFCFLSITKPLFGSRELSGPNQGPAVIRFRRSRLDSPPQVQNSWILESSDIVGPLYYLPWAHSGGYLS